MGKLFCWQLLIVGNFTFAIYVVLLIVGNFTFPICVVLMLNYFDSDMSKSTNMVVYFD
jgi:hypothetical protein